MVSSAIVDKYIGESARLIREMFGEDFGGSESCGELVISIHVVHVAVFCQESMWSGSQALYL